MSGVLFTGLGTLSPKVYNIFLLLMAVGFFGVYVPWNEKKKKGGQMSIGSAAPRQEKPHTPMSRARALAAVIGCIPVMTVGLTMLIACAIMGQPLWMAIGAVLTIFSLVRMLRAGEDFRAGRQSKPAPQKPKTAPSFRPAPVGAVGPSFGGGHPHQGGVRRPPPKAHEGGLSHEAQHPL